MMENQELQWYNYFIKIHRRNVLLVYWAILHKKRKIRGYTIFYFYTYILFFNVKLWFTRSKSKWHVQPFLKERIVHGHYHCLTSELQLTNSEQYQNFIRMSASKFEELVCLVRPKIKRFPSRPDIISVGEILTATLR